MLTAHSQGTLPRGVKPFTLARQSAVQPAAAGRRKQAAVQCAAAKPGNTSAACTHTKPHEIAAVVVVVALLLSLHWGDVSMHVHLNPSFPNLMRADASSSSDASSSRRQALLAAAGAALVPCMPAAAFSLPGFGGQESAAPVAEPAPAVGVCLAAQNAAAPDHALPWHSLHVHQA